jgi:hypothetical protein
MVHRVQVTAQWRNMYVTGFLSIKLALPVAQALCIAYQALVVQHAEPGLQA